MRAVAGAHDTITDDIVAAAEETYRRFRRHDPAFLEGIDLDVEWHVPDSMPGGGTLHGQLAVLQFMDRISQFFEDAHPEPKEFLPAGEALVVLGTWHARARSTRVRVAIPFAHVLRFRRGKTVYLYTYMDPAAALQALEARPRA